MLTPDPDKKDYFEMKEALFEMGFRPYEDGYDKYLRLQLPNYYINVSSDLGLDNAVLPLSNRPVYVELLSAYAPSFKPVLREGVEPGNFRELVPIVRNMIQYADPQWSADQVADAAEGFLPDPGPKTAQVVDKMGRDSFKTMMSEAGKMGFKEYGNLSGSDLRLKLSRDVSITMRLHKRRQFGDPMNMYPPKEGEPVIVSMYVVPNDSYSTDVRSFASGNYLDVLEEIKAMVREQQDFDKFMAGLESMKFVEEELEHGGQGYVLSFGDYDLRPGILVYSGQEQSEDTPPAFGRGVHAEYFDQNGDRMMEYHANYGEYQSLLPRIRSMVDYAKEPQWSDDQIADAAEGFVGASKGGLTKTAQYDELVKKLEALGMRPAPSQGNAMVFEIPEAELCLLVQAATDAFVITLRWWNPVSKEPSDRYFDRYFAYSEEEALNAMRERIPDAEEYRRFIKALLGMGFVKSKLGRRYEWESGDYGIYVSSESSPPMPGRRVEARLTHHGELVKEYQAVPGDLASLVDSIQAMQAAFDQQSMWTDEQIADAAEGFVGASSGAWVKSAAYVNYTHEQYVKALQDLGMRPSPLVRERFGNAMAYDVPDSSMIVLVQEYGSPTDYTVSIREAAEPTGYSDPITGSAYARETVYTESAAVDAVKQKIQEANGFVAFMKALLGMGFVLLPSGRSYKWESGEHAVYVSGSGGRPVPGKMVYVELYQSGEKVKEYTSYEMGKLIDDLKALVAAFGAGKEWTDDQIADAAEGFVGASPVQGGLAKTAQPRLQVEQDGYGLNDMVKELEAMGFKRESWLWSGAVGTGRFVPDSKKPMILKFPSGLLVVVSDFLGDRDELTGVSGHYTVMIVQGRETRATEWFRSPVDAMASAKHMIGIVEDFEKFMAGAREMGFRNNFGDFEWMDAAPGTAEQSVLVRVEAPFNEIPQVGREVYVTLYSNREEVERLSAKPGNLVSLLDPIKTLISHYRHRPWTDEQIADAAEGFVVSWVRGNCKFAQPFSEPNYPWFLNELESMGFRRGNWEKGMHASVPADRRPMFRRVSDDYSVAIADIGIDTLTDGRETLQHPPSGTPEYSVHILFVGSINYREVYRGFVAAADGAKTAIEMINEFLEFRGELAKMGFDSGRSRYPGYEWYSAPDMPNMPEAKPDQIRITDGHNDYPTAGRKVCVFLNNELVTAPEGLGPRMPKLGDLRALAVRIRAMIAHLKRPEWTEDQIADAAEGFATSAVVGESKTAQTEPQGPKAVIDYYANDYNKLLRALENHGFERSTWPDIPHGSIKKEDKPMVLSFPSGHAIAVSNANDTGRLMSVSAPYWGLQILDHGVIRYRVTATTYPNVLQRVEDLKKIVDDFDNFIAGIRALGFDPMGVAYEWEEDVGLHQWDIPVDHPDYYSPPRIEISSIMNYGEHPSSPIIGREVKVMVRSPAYPNGYKDLRGGPGELKSLLEEIKVEKTHLSRPQWTEQQVADAAEGFLPQQSEE